MRYVLGFLCVCALGTVALVGCGETAGDGGSGGSAGTGGIGGSGGTGGTGGDGGTSGTGGTGGGAGGIGGAAGFAGSGGVGGTGGTRICENDGDCYDQNSCRLGVCNPTDSMCDYATAEDGTPCMDSQTGVFGFCAAGRCVQCETDADCDTGRDCTVETCNVTEGRCNYSFAEDGTACEESGVCLRGNCQPRCESDAECDDYHDCTADACIATGLCENAPVQDGTPCAGGVCRGSSCALEDSVQPCSEQGIRNAVYAGFGVYTFECSEPTIVVTEAEIVLGNKVILDGEGNLTIDGNESHRVFTVGQGATAELRNLSVTRGASAGSGGGIYNWRGSLTLRNTTVSGNTAEHGGGGIYCGWGSSLTLIDGAVSENASSAGGGISSQGTVTVTNSTVSGNFAEHSGGGILNITGILTVTDSTVSDNISRLDFGNTGGGGGICNCHTSGTVILTNSTLSGNSAQSHGGGLMNTGTATLTNSTVSENTATISGSAIRSNLSHTEYNPTLRMTLANSTVTGSIHLYYGPSLTFPPFVVGATIIDGSCSYSGSAPTWTSEGYNLESPGDTCGFAVTVDDLKLGPLQNNGGATETHALEEGSPAIDQIPVEDCLDADGEPLTTDQRGLPRPGGTMCDVGTFEVQP